LLYLSSVELRQICYFLAVTEAGNNFTKAAEYLQIDPPPLGQRIKSLERKLKVELFDRQRRPLQLTAAGKVFLEETRLALTTLERGIARAQQAHRGEIGFLSVGIASSISNTLLPDILRAFRSRFPDIEVELLELTAERQLQALREGRLNIGFEVVANAQEPDTSLNVLPIMEESLVVAMPELHPLVFQRQVFLRDLANEKLILPSIAEFPFYQKFIYYCQQSGFEPNIIRDVQATWLVTILSLVVAQVGLAILPSNVENLQRRGVVYRPIQDTSLRRQISALWRKDDHSVVLAEFLKIVADLSGSKLPE
uniref:LysR family transcriptional regulator n=1 Tax=Chamaesiphon sp. OTE_8_metabat_110 TaxID=2964696 RepID=UPI00286A9943